MLMTHHHVPMFIYGKMKKKIEYQASLRNEQTCIAFEEMLKVVVAIIYVIFSMVCWKMQYPHFF